MSVYSPAARKWLLLLALALAARPATASDADPWFGPDKALHFGLSAGLAAGDAAAGGDATLAGEAAAAGDDAAARDPLLRRPTTRPWCHQRRAKGRTAPQRSALDETFVIEYRVERESGGAFVYQIRFGADAITVTLS